MIYFLQLLEQDQVQISRAALTRTGRDLEMFLAQFFPTVLSVAALHCPAGQTDQ